ncbi:hypothetical protein CKQ84_18795 [Shewanella sp. WE21]|uniref:hypothetical protein n=1 Tax=Shewanella sp. WE21 TaxID=2029986 RepID=UPI000CF5E1CA|nr:hypothetical protein [Shewanella sp. WE21]AVI67730.1 hypothetical protein CKQ84_18795 [Shewanella sp. WE21]
MNIMNFLGITKCSHHDKTNPIKKDIQKLNLDVTNITQSLSGGSRAKVKSFVLGDAIEKVQAKYAKVEKGITQLDEKHSDKIKASKRFKNMEKAYNSMNDSISKSASLKVYSNLISNSNSNISGRVEKSYLGDGNS